MKVHDPTPADAPHLSITRNSGLIVEASANGFTVPEIAQLTGQTVTVVRAEVRQLISDLDTEGYYYSPLRRAVTASIAGKLLIKKDLVPPGEAFTPTMEPRWPARIGYYEVPQDEIWSLQHPCIMPKAGEAMMGEQVITPLERTMLSCWGLGMSLEQAIPTLEMINPVGSHTWTYYQAIGAELLNKLGVRNRTQASAYAALHGITSTYKRLLNPDKAYLVKPTKCRKPQALTIDRPAYAYRQPNQFFLEKILKDVLEPGQGQ